MKVLCNSIRRFGTAKERNYQLTWEETGFPPNYNPKESNLTPRIWSLTKRKLYKQPNHPIYIIKNRTKTYFDGKVKAYATFPIRSNESFAFLEDLSFMVSTKQCFDDLNVPLDHISRGKSDTYYINNSTILRTQTSAHQVDIMKAGYNSFLVLGDVYRRDEINHTHYPAFHQLEGVRLFTIDELGTSDITKAKKLVEQDLKSVLVGLAK